MNNKGMKFGRGRKAHQIKKQQYQYLNNRHILLLVLLILIPR